MLFSFTAIAEEKTDSQSAESEDSSMDMTDAKEDSVSAKMSEDEKEADRIIKGYLKDFENLTLGVSLKQSLDVFNYDINKYLADYLAARKEKDYSPKEEIDLISRLQKKHATKKLQFQKNDRYTWIAPDTEVYAELLYDYTPSIATSLVVSAAVDINFIKFFEERTLLDHGKGFIEQFGYPDLYAQLTLLKFLHHGWKPSILGKEKVNLGSFTGYFFGAAAYNGQKKYYYPGEKLKFNDYRVRVQLVHQNFDPVGPISIFWDKLKIRGYNTSAIIYQKSFEPQPKSAKLDPAILYAKSTFGIRFSKQLFTSHIFFFSLYESFISLADSKDYMKLFDKDLIRREEKFSISYQTTFDAFVSFGFSVVTGNVATKTSEGKRSKAFSFDYSISYEFL